MMYWSVQWFDDCKRLYNRILRGKYAHRCPTFDNKPIDETVEGGVWGARCTCFRCKCGQLMNPKQYPMGIKPILRMHENMFICPRSRWWNFWRHDEKDFS